MTTGTEPTLTTEKLSLQQYMPDWADGTFDAKHGGDWVKYEDVSGIMSYIDGYLHAHAAMLESQGVHSKIIDAVNQLRKQLDAV